MARGCFFKTIKTVLLLLSRVCVYSYCPEKQFRQRSNGAELRLSLL